MRTNSAAEPQLTTHAGAPARTITPAQELRRSVLANMLFEDSFYEDGQSVASRIATLIPQVAPEEVATIAIEARMLMKLRHVPLLLVRELARQGYNVESALTQIIQRPDELAEFLAIYWADKDAPKGTSGRRQPLSASVKRGLAKAFTKFSAYSLAKYNRPEMVKLRDVLFLVHAKPKDVEQEIVWKQLVEGTLPVPDTWEVELSKGGSKLESWTRLLLENKLGALALLRNLRNMQDAGVSPETIAESLDACNPEWVLPFRFITAARHAPALESQLETLMFKCLKGKAKLPGHTILAVDRSGSMSGKMSGKSELTRFEAAAALAMLLKEVSERSTVIAFEYAPHIMPSSKRGFELRRAMGSPAGGTNTEGAKQLADQIGYDRLIILTDEQSHTALSNPRGKGYVVNVANYQNGIGYGEWTHIDGFSEAVLDYIQAAETGGPA